MNYRKIQIEGTTIEFHNNILGFETVIVNGQIVSKKYSFWGIDHFFTLINGGHTNHYVLTSRVDGNTLTAYLDLRKDGKLIKENIEIKYGTKALSPKNKFKKSGIARLNDYDIAEGLSELKKALTINAEDPEIYFYLACGYSIQENAIQGFENLKMAVEHNLENREMILNHDKLAYLRMQEGFEEFLDSNFTEYDITKLSK